MRFSARISSAAAFVMVAAFSVGSAALADTLQLTLNASSVVNISSPNDSHFGQYVNSADAPYLIDNPEAWGEASILFSPLSTTVPMGSTITQALVSIVVSSGPFEGTGYEFPVLGLQFGGELVPNVPRVAPIFSTTGTSVITLSGIDVEVPAMIDGDEVYSQFSGVSLDYIGYIQSALEDPGSNWAGYLGGTGQVDVSYTEELNVTYTPVPEPSTLALFGTGIFGLAGIARRKFLHS